MKKQLIPFLLILILPVLATAQTGTTFSYPGTEYGYRVKPTLDGGFIIGGNIDSKGAGDFDYWVLRFDKDERLLWDSAYGTADFENLWTVTSTSDNGALLAGFSGVQYSGTEEALMYKIDSVGKVVKKIEVNYPLADHSHWFIEAPDHTYYWAGHTDSKGDPSGDMIAQRLDKNFNVMWEKTYDFGSAEHCHAGALAHSNGVMLIGHTSIGNHEHYYGVRADSNGNILWQRSYSTASSNDDSPYDVVATSDGGFAFFGGTTTASNSSTAWLLVVDSAGNIRINKHYNIGDCFGWSGMQLSDGGFVIIGSSSPGVNQSNLYIVRTDSAGNKVWEKTYGGGIAEGLGVCEHNGHFVAVGDIANLQDSTADLWVLELDQNGEALPPLSVAEEPSFASGVTLDQNYPNPAGERTMIGFSLPTDDHIRLTLLNELGENIQTICDNALPLGSHYFAVTTSSLANGTYYYQLQTSTTTITKKLQVIHTAKQ